MSASSDVIATLSSRVSELSKRVALLEADLDAAQKRLAVYEEHDHTIQDALSGALRAAYTIRESAETTAGQILEQAREERRMLLKEIERLRDERDALQNEIADARRMGIAAVAARPLSSDTAAQELRAVASEALRGLFQEIVDDIRSAPREAPAPIPQPPAPVRVEEPPAANAPEPAPPPPAPAPERPTYEYMAKVKRVAAVEEEETPVAAAPEPVTHEDVEVAAPEPVVAVAPEPVVAAEPEPVAPPVPEPVAEAAPPAAPPLEVVSSREVEEIAPPRVETTGPTSEIQLVLSPVPSFPRLVEIERQIQSLPTVRTLYVRDFRGGVATLAIALRSAMTPDEFATTLAGLAEPRMRLVSSNRNSLELRIDGAASIA